MRQLSTATATNRTDAVGPDPVTAYALRSAIRDARWHNANDVARRADQLASELARCRAIAKACHGQRIYASGTV